MTNPFSILGIDENADDEIIRHAYLQQIRLFPPERDPDRFQAIHQAYETIKSKRDRLRYRLFSMEPPQSSTLINGWLKAQTLQRPSEKSISRLLAKSLEDYRIPCG